MSLDDGHVAVVGLGYGDEGKGTIVDWLCATRKFEAVVRFNGGAQAGHNVVLPDGRHHTFAQWGSGTLRGVPTLLSRYVVVDPQALFNERAHLMELGVKEPFDLLYVDYQALIATPYHAAVNQAREIARMSQCHGSVGIGVGETVSYSMAHPDKALRFSDIRSGYATRTKLQHLIDWCQDTMTLLGVQVPIPTLDEYDSLLLRLSGVKQGVDGDYFLKQAMSRASVVFEGAQGVLLDEWFGFYPYVTRSTTTFHNVGELTDQDVYRLGVLRTYATRHGPGPFPTQDTVLDEDIREQHNITGRWQGAFRIGHFDAVAHRYAIDVCERVDGIALTHLDIAERVPDLRFVHSYDGTSRLIFTGERNLEMQEQQLTKILLRFSVGYDLSSHLDPGNKWVEFVSQLLGVPVVVTSHGPTSDDKRRVSEAGLVT